MTIYCTEYTVSNEVGRVCKMCGEIEADSLEEAEEIGEKIGHTVLGELLEEIDAPEFGDFCDRVQKQRDEDWLRNNPKSE